MKKKQKAYKLKIVLVFTFLLLICLIGFFLITKNIAQEEVDNNIIINKENNLTKYVSEDLNIKLDYPSSFFIKDLGYRILITNYELIKNINYRPRQDEIEIQISIHNNCKISLDEEMRIGNCFAEGNFIPNEILSKQVKELTYTTLFIYTIKQPSSPQRTRYILKSGDKMIEISKSPDPSLFENEFEEIISSITFL